LRIASSWLIAGLGPKCGVAADDTAPPRRLVPVMPTMTTTARSSFEIAQIPPFVIPVIDPSSTGSGARRYPSVSKNGTSVLELEAESGKLSRSLSKGNNVGNPDR